MLLLIFPDHGSRYMSKVYSDEWMEAQGFLDANNTVKAPESEVYK